jgi:hypothetical protein
MVSTCRGTYAARRLLDASSWIARAVVMLQTYAVLERIQVQHALLRSSYLLPLRLAPVALALHVPLHCALRTHTQ